MQLGVCMLGVKGHVSQVPVCTEVRAVIDYVCVCVSWVWVYLVFEVCRRLKSVSGSVLGERKRCYSL